MNRLSALQEEIHQQANSEKAVIFQRFFKTGKGQYGEGDKFLGLTVPQSRSIAKKYNSLPYQDITVLLHSSFHEERLIALFILVDQFKRRDTTTREKIYRHYLDNTTLINNWDLVDSSADKIVGGYLLDKKDRSILTKLADSQSLWDRRIAIITTYQFIKEKKEYEDTFRIAEILLHDKHDLIHKAVGWMLREVGGRISPEKEEVFLKKYYKIMPRTMLRYAIEKFPGEKRKKYLKGEV